VQSPCQAARQRHARMLMDEGSYPAALRRRVHPRHPDQRMKRWWRPVTGAPRRQACRAEPAGEALAAWAVERTPRAPSRWISSMARSIGHHRRTWIYVADWQYARRPRVTSTTRLPQEHAVLGVRFSRSDATHLLAIVHERYQGVIGDEFGKTVMGFMGDEPTASRSPDAQSFDEFQSRKGYDCAQMSSLLTSSPTASDRRVQADYSDVWSALYRESYFRVQADWCAATGWSTRPLNNDDNLTPCVARGRLFPRHALCTVPGVDAIWRQICRHGGRLPKLASSAAHLNAARARSARALPSTARAHHRAGEVVMDYEFVRASTCSSAC